MTVVAAPPPPEHGPGLSNSVILPAGAEIFTALLIETPDIH
jgi:hypothetical protein